MTKTSRENLKDLIVDYCNRRIMEERRKKMLELLKYVKKIYFEKKGEKEMKLNIILLIICILLLLFMISTILCPMKINAGEFNADLTIGYDPNPIINMFSTDLNMEYVIHPWIFDMTAYGGVTILMTNSPNPGGFNPIAFQPQVNIYTIGINLGYELISIGYTHFCIHPADLEKYIIYTYEDLYFQSSDRFYIRISSRK